jgi:hypothetical protein
VSRRYIHFGDAEEKTCFFLCESYILRNLYNLIAALFFIYEHLKFPASAFHDFNKRVEGKKQTFAK